MCQSSLIYSSTFSIGQLQQQKPFWSDTVYTCRGTLLLYRRLCQLSYQQTHSAIARAWITVTGYNFPTACGTPAAGQHAVIQHSMARTNIFFSPLNESPQAQAMPCGKGAGNRHCFKQLSNPALSSKARQSVWKKASKQTFLFLIYLLFSKWEGRGESTGK